MKSFRWFDKYNLSIADDRKTRRLMEAKNKKMRDSARKEFNETVRNLALFVRKRDSRFFEFQEILKSIQEDKIKETKEKNLKMSKERIEKIGSYVEQNWQKNNLNDILDSSDSHSDPDEQSESGNFEDSLYCLSCDKKFQSLQQVFILIL